MSWLQNIARTALCLGLVGFMGCLPMSLAGTGNNTNTEPPPNTDPPVNALQDPNHPGIEVCSSGHTQDDIEDNLAIARAFEQSCHEMVVCGGLSFALTTSLIDVLVNAANGDETHPSGFSYVGGGTYLVGDQMEVTLGLAQDTSFGKAGEAVLFDLFNISSYFTSVTLKASASIDTTGKTRTSIGISFDGLGPAVELLGLGPNPKSPLEVDLEDIAAALGRMVQITSKVHIKDQEGNTDDPIEIKYTLDSQPMPIADLLAGKSMQMLLVSAAGTRQNTGQTLEVLDWDMTYQRAGIHNILDGTIHFAAKGGSSFPYEVSFTYPRRPEPDVSLSCGPM